MMTESEIIKNLLDINYGEDETISTLSVAIRNSRELSDREVETGKKKNLINTDRLENSIINNTYEGSKFIALANYLIIIDLIGNIFKKCNQSEIKDGFKQTLKHFTTLDDLEIKSLKNLRNALAHKFSLGNESEVFTLDYSENSKNIIELPFENYPSHKRSLQKTEKNLTIVYFENICDLVENVYSELKCLESKNQLEILSKYKVESIINIFDIKSMYFIK